MKSELKYSILLSMEPLNDTLRCAHKGGFELVKIEIVGPFYRSLIPELKQAFLDRANVEILIDSEGGKKRFGYEATSAIRYMVEQGLSVQAIVTGQALSAAFMILQACSNRRALPNATLMFHAPAKLRFGREGEDAFVDERNPNEPGYVSFLEELSKRSRIDFSQLQEWGSQEKVFTAAEALRFGFIDEIVEAWP